MERLIGALLCAGLGLAAPARAQAPEPPLPPPRPEAAAPAPAEASRESACVEALARLGVRFEPRPPVADGACGVADPVLVLGLPDGVAVSPPALMTCPLAQGLARWTLDTLIPEAQTHLRAAPTRLAIGTSYECRNQRSGEKLSEHAFGNGVDISGVEFKDRPAVTVGFLPDGSPEAAFQAAVRKGACSAFSTVLGPGSDAAHGDHLHLDQRARRGGYRICQ